MNQSQRNNTLMNCKLPKFQEIQYQFSHHLRSPEKVAGPDGVEDRRLKIYRDLFYNNVENFCSNSFPILRSLFVDKEWHQLTRYFFSEYQAKSPYFKDISKAFLDFLNDDAFNVELPFDCMRELAHWEWMELATYSHQDEILKFPHDRNGDLVNQKVVVSPLAFPLVYSYPVHKIGESYLPEEVPECPTFLIISRNRQDEVDFMETNALTYRLLELFQESERVQNKQLTGLEALDILQKELNFPNPEALLEGGKSILDDFLKRDVVLGTNP